MRRTIRRLSAGFALALAATTAAAPAGVSAPLGHPPERIFTPSGMLQGPDVASDGTTYFNDGGDLLIYGAGATGTDPVPLKEITGVGSDMPAFHPTQGIVVDNAASDGVLVVDPGQAAGAVTPVRTISGATTQIGNVGAAAWAPDGSIWVFDTDIGGMAGYELLRFAPGANGNVAPTTTVSGDSTRLAESLYGQVTLDTLPDGSAVVAGIGFEAQVLVFPPTASGNVAPARRIDVALDTPLSVLTGATADATGRIYAATGDLSGENWGHVYVYAAGANGAATPVFDVTGSASKLHLPLAPDVASNGRWAVSSAVVVGGSPAITRQLVFGPIPPTPSGPSAMTAPSAPTALKVARKGTSMVVRWKPPAKGPVASYRVQVRKGKKVVATKTVTKTSVRVRRSKLPSGKLKAVVVASNAAGSSPAATKAFRK